MTQPQPELIDLYRAGLRSAADLMKASLESAERLQNQQLAAIRGALEQQVKSAGELGQARSMDELLALQTKMASAQWERMIGYWTGVVQAAGQNQMAAMAQASDWLNDAATQMQTATAGARQQSSKQEQRKSA